MATCSCIIRTGNRAGQECGKTAKYFNPEPRCGIHKESGVRRQEQLTITADPRVQNMTPQVPQVNNQSRQQGRPENALIFFGPKGASIDDVLTPGFTAFDPEFVQPDPIGDRFLSQQNMYVNIRVGSPVFNQGETMYITLPVKDNADFEKDAPLTQLEVARQVAEQLFNFYKNPCNYDLNDRYCLHHLFLYAICYNDNAGVFEAKIKTRYEICD